MIKPKHKILVLKDISVSDQRTMGLAWAWEAGAKVTFIRDYGHDFYHNEREPCSLVMVHHIKDEDRRELWVFDMFLVDLCIWN